MSAILTLDELKEQHLHAVFVKLGCEERKRYLWQKASRVVFSDQLWNDYDFACEQLTRAEEAAARAFKAYKKAIV